MKTLSVNVSEYEWSIIPFPSMDGSFVLNVIDKNDGERIFVVPGLKTDTLTEFEKKYMLNIYLSGFYKGSRAGAAKKAAELRRIIGIED